ncbi:MAG: flagellar hook assembly protein FlgD [Pseudomonadota bacterium]
MTAIDNFSRLQDLGLTGRPNEVTTQSADQDQFLELMLAQFENQDPFEPMENGEFLSQLAQFSTATGIDELKDAFDGFAANVYSDQALQASSLVGRDLLVATDAALLNGSGQGIQGAITVEGASGNVTIDVLDASGQLVRSIDLGVRQAGDVPFTWDGFAEDGQLAPAGGYSFEARISRRDEVERVPTLIRARADSVTLGGSGQGVTVNSLALGAFSLDNVRQIF